MNPLAIIVIIVVVCVFVIALGLKNLLYIAPPNKVIIFSGRPSGPKFIKGAWGVRIPIFERVDHIDLSNMVIDLSATNAYAKGGVPLNVQGVANVKIAGHEPVLNHAIERFLGKGRAEIMGIAKATLEGSLRGVLATLTPEQLNEDRNAFAVKLVAEVEADMTGLGLVVDTLKIQNITDDVHYLDSIGRVRNAELKSRSRIAEAIARADSIVRNAENSELEVRAEVTAAIEVAKADAEKNLADILSRKGALVAEELADVAALVAQADAEVKVQTERIEQVRYMLEADVVAPAKAQCEAKEQNAKAKVAPIVEDGKARAEALRSLAASWNRAGDQAREIFLLQKIEPIIDKLTDTISDTKIEKVTIIDSKMGGGGTNPAQLLALSEQVKEVFGIDVVSKLQEMSATKKPDTPARMPIEAKAQTKPQPKKGVVKPRPAEPPRNPEIEPPPRPSFD